MITEKASIKQDAYRNTLDTFHQLKALAENLIENVKGKTSDERVTVSLQEIHEFEFHVIIGGDLIAFKFQTNVFMLPFDEKTMMSPYFKEKKGRVYFGQIFIYNFMADSFKYNRKEDLGYLISRLSINCEKHFFLEGLKSLSFIHPEVEKNDISNDFLEKLLNDLIHLAIDTDIVSSNYTDNFHITVEKSLSMSPLSSVNKMGFQMSEQSNKIN